MAQSGGTISTYEFFQRFPDEWAAIQYIESRRWPKGVICPLCQRERTSRQRDRRYHQCKDCRKKFTVRTGTIFHRSHIPLNKWLYAMYLLQTARKGISSMQLSKELGITQKAAWFLLHRLREACDVKAERIGGQVEIDETLQNEIEDNVEAGSTVYTDEFASYRKLSRLYEPGTVAHSVQEFVNGMAHTNGIESVWAALKRGYNGVYHQWSKKHMRRYVNEFAFRMNEENVSVHTLKRLDSLVEGTFNKRITYEELIA